MLKIYRSILVVFCALFAVVLIAKGWQLITDGFRLDKIAERLPKSGSIVPEAVIGILDQDFHYLSKGCQVYVFESSDRQYVLKFLRYHKYKTPFWMNAFRCCAPGRAYCQKRIAHRVKAKAETLRSYDIAISCLQEETGVLYSHLARTHSRLRPVCLIDRLGRKMHVALDECGFVLQKKVIPLEKELDAAAKNQDSEAFRAIFASFLATYRQMCLKGIVNRDYNCVKNSGMLEKRVLGMDLGSFFYAENLQSRSAFEAEVRHFAKHFRKWVVKNSPAFLPVYEAEINKIVLDYGTEN